MRGDPEVRTRTWGDTFPLSNETPEHRPKSVPLIPFLRGEDPDGIGETLIEPSFLSTRSNHSQTHTRHTRNVYTNTQIHPNHILPCHAYSYTYAGIHTVGPYSLQRTYEEVPRYLRS